MSSDEDVTTYRSRPAMAVGVLLIAVGIWMIIDTLVRGEGRTKWLAIAMVIFFAVLVIALTLRSAVLVGPERLVIRNPFRTIVVPWGALERVRAEYSIEVRAGDKSFHIWAIPVSLRERKRALRQQGRSAAENPYGQSQHDLPQLSRADQVVDDLRGMSEQFGKKSTGPVEVAWSMEIIGGMALSGIAALILGLV
ncbi:PH domain-containing protein [Embleya sp. NBC_00896]|uniref:PH domain-containing protein n=1 Tax=Embleya sp. NBC_00896 TaxID=2975961 RepID=UPI00386CD149|nr:PH domain-containing protein [Embleya sp. NBC_00896]